MTFKQVFKNIAQAASSLTFRLLTASILLSGSTACQSDANDPARKNQSKISENMPGTDSMVVERLIERSKIQYSQNQGTSVIEDNYLKEADEIAQKNNNFSQQARVYNLLGQRYHNKANYGKAMEHHQKALDYSTWAQNVSILAETYNNIGTVYRKIDDNPMALELHVKALHLAEEANDSLLISSAINSIGNVNFNLGRYASSVEYFRRSLAIARQMSDTLGIAINHNNLGKSLLKLNKPDSALSHFLTSLDYNYQIDHKIGQSVSLNSLGTAYIALKRPHKALEYLEKALLLNKKTGNLLHISNSYAKIGKIHLAIGNLGKAEVNLIQSLETARRIESMSQKEEAAGLLSKLYEKKGNHENALTYFKKSAAYRDSLLNEKNIHQLATQEAIFDSERQRERIQELNQQTLRQKNMLTRQRFVLILSLVVVIVVSFIIIMIVRQSQLRSKFKSVRHQQRLLRSQMNPHFIFNALSAIQVYILEHDIERSSRFLTDFARLMRQVLHSSNHDYISLKEEARILGYYLELQKLRFSEAFEYSISVDESLDQEHVMVPPMLTQPFIENAIEHGLRPIGNDGQIHIRFKAGKTQMTLEVEDNGIGIDTSKKESEKEKGHDSMAIKITRERLEMLRRDSGGKTSLSITDKKHLNPFDRGTLVKIELPIVNKNSKPEKNLLNKAKLIKQNVSLMNVNM